MRVCGCHPGTAENHWFEQICSDCLAEEREVWRKLTERLREEQDLRTNVKDS